ncbi:cadherin repeat domain-containing protein, partial [bacterium]|nr:cadherin repeat domain-containing protein [bacterium]
MQIFSHSSLNVQIRINADGTLRYAGVPPLYSNTTGSSIGELDANQLVMVSFIFNDKLEFSINGHWEQSTAGMTIGGRSVYNQIGTISSSTNRFNGKMGELIIMDSKQATDRQNVEAYLAHKWGLVYQLPPSHPGYKDVLLTAASFDYETNASTYNIHVRATANGSVQNEKKYKILLSNVVEDLDEDGIEDHYDLDDDGDGFPDLIEIAYPSDPRDPSSHANVAPNELNASGSLTISEDVSVGTLVTTLSASDPDGDQNLTYDIAQSVEQLGPVLWLDANHPSASSAVWEDQSLYRKDAIRYHSPTVVKNVQNGLSVMRYETNETTPDYHEWDSINNIRTVVAVLKRDSGSILSNSGDHHFWSASTKMLHWGNAHVYLREGISRLNGLALDATITDCPNSKFFLLSFVPTGNVSATRIGRDRSQTNLNYHFDGDYGELLLFDKGLEGIDLLSVEHYLAQKWGLMGNLNSTHPYKDANHTSVAEHLSIDGNGILRLAQPLDYETDANYSILASVTDPSGYSFYKSCTLTVGDVFEDLDGDNIADHLDMDMDGDGLSNADEMVGYSDPRDENSTNLPPTNIQENNTLTVSENLPSGTVISHFNGSDPNGNHTLSYLLFEGSSLPKPSTVYLRDSLLAYFPFDEINGTIAHNFDTDGSDANLLNGAEFVTNEKKFGRSALYLPWNMQKAQARIEKPVELGKDNQSDPYSISVW